ncbi:hydroxysqualene dehydroxylase HpnE [Methylobacillus gramineus]|uniref:hydroxysqualene dehydroxylase HpnE n=1 Tax=Methylobacillus gramineus TaxID=755169 RepID=UPI001CFFFE31|nr:hydroxysqualene dehydroxylase HpnE [Methylobacillus gramineus]MCB5184429.1 hydroxysqualene dehydroxylase HpnE [Methylobacillus gramineus]
MGTQLTPNVAVIGGGCAGLAAGVALSKAGIRVNLFESSHQLGGRARGIQWQGQTLDNGQHILLGAYSATLQLLETCEVQLDQALLRLPLELNMQDEFSLRASSYLPAPLHILAGLLRAQGLSLSERLAAIRLMARLRLQKFTLEQDMPLQALLADQPARLISMLWEPLCLAALNTPVSTASAQIFLNVLRDSFARAKSDSDMLLPRLDLSTMLADPAASYILAHGGQVSLSAPIECISQQNKELYLQVADIRKAYKHIIVATSPFRVAPLLADLPSVADSVEKCQALKYQPIYTIYLQYPAHIKLDKPMTGLSHQLGQWIFDRGQLYGQHGLIAVVISAEGRHQGLTQEQLAIGVAEEIEQLYPQLNNLLWHKVVAEKRATFACTSNLQRPAQLTSIPGLLLAGDYVSSGNTLQDYPSTIEGAIRSGFSAAGKFINSL